jgi:putative peptide zinc metalloprotease protein
MRESLFSPLWYRVAAQHPQLRVDVRVQRQHYRDQLWYVLINDTTGRQFRINHKAYQVIGRCDGRRSVQQVWDILLEQLGDEAPTQDEVIRMLSQLDQHGLLGYEASPDVQALVQQRDQRVKRQLRGFLNPFAFRVPLGDPTPLLKRLDWLGAALCNPVTLYIWFAVMALAASAAAANFSALSIHASTYMGTPHYLLLAWVSFPLIKALHELGHALAVRHWGGEVHSTGVSLFVLTPAPYVDASASAGFRARYQRAMVAAIGVMVELAIAAAALGVWLNVQPGLIRDVAFVTMFTASVSTVLFNGNPLLTFDAYYVMCDALDLPNLAARSKTYWTDLLQRIALGVGSPSPVQPGAGEQKWLVLYAPLSVGYRISVSAVIVLWVGAQSLFLGVLASVFIAATVLVMPLYAAVRHVLANAPAGKRRWHARGVVGATAAALVVLLCVVPFPFYTSAAGVIWLPEQAQVRAETDGFVAKIVARDGERVETGQLLVVLTDPVLLAERDKLASQLQEFEADRFATLRSDPYRAQNIEQDIARVQGDIKRADEKLAQLDVRAQMAGALVMPRQQDLQGAFAKRGSILGYVFDRAEIGVRATVSEKDAALVKERTRGVDVRMAEASGERVVAEMVRDIPAATHQLPSAALGDRGGGPYVTDPADKDALRTLEPVVLIDLKLPQKIVQRVGGRAWVRFDHGAEPLAGQGYRRLRQIFLQHFNPTG